MAKRTPHSTRGATRKLDPTEATPDRRQKREESGPAPAPTEVVILGTIHKPWNKRFLAADIERILVALKPVAILLEISPFGVMPRTGRIVPKVTKAGKLSKRLPLHQADRDSQEDPAVKNASRRLRVRVHPIDIENLGLYFQQNRPLERLGRTNAIIRDLLDYLAGKDDPRSRSNRIALRLLGRVYNDGEDLMRCAPLDVLNSKGFDDLRRTFNDLRDDLVPAVCAQYRAFVEKHYPGYDKFVEDHAAFVGFWHSREKTMADHIARIARDHPGRRLAVVVGNFHRAGLRDLLADCAHVRLREFWEILPERKWVAR